MNKTDLRIFNLIFALRKTSGAENIFIKTIFPIRRILHKKCIPHKFRWHKFNAARFSPEANVATLQNRVEKATKSLPSPSMQRKKKPESCSGLKFSFTRNQPPVRLWMIWIIGKNSAITIVPTTTAKNTIIIGSITDVMAPTALSTSSS